MKKLCLLLMITSIAFSCKKQKEEPSILAVSQSTINKPSDAFEQKISITANGKWYVNTDEDWVNLSKEEGFGNSEVIVSADENTSVLKRTAKVRLMLNNETKVIAVTQEGREKLKISKSFLKSGIAASTITLDVSSKTDWHVTVPTDITWFSVNPTNGTGNGTVTVSINENTNAADRNGNFKIANALDEINISVSQDGTNPAAALPGWNLVFFDEFNTNGNFNNAKWDFSKRWSSTVAWVKFLTEDPKYASVSDGNLVLRMDNETIAGDNVPYHSAGVETVNKFSFTYGKVEVRAKFKQGRGSWPAIWMMPVAGTYGGWPNSGEIDIMEHVNNETKIHQTVHNGAVTNSGGSSSATSSSSFNVNDYNTYGIEWTETALKFFLNGNLTYTYNKPANATSASWPYDKPFYLILNQSGGAGWPGPITDSDLPFEMKVDWVRIYQK